MIEKIESGERRPSSQIAEKLAECLQVPADERRAFAEFARARLPAERLALLAQADDRAPWRTLYRRSTNLPSPHTPFIGREKEVAAACALLRQPGVRLLTMSGPPGIGKTRLSLRVAEELMEDFEGRVFFVELAPVRNPDLVIPCIAASLNLREVGGEPLIQSLKRYLGDKRALLVLDNFEQVVEAAYEVGDLLTSSPWLKVLVSSREILHIYGEYEFQVPSLDLPPMNYLPPVEQLMGYEAVRLFTERAAAARPDFALTPENAAAVVEICSRLDRVPLAIELAAARARSLPPLEIVRRLDSNLELLTGGARDLPPRQRALRSAIDWSYDLLNEEERRIFRRMSIFVGGCTRQAAETVCGGMDDGTRFQERGSHSEVDSSVSTELESLVDKSLVRQEETKEGMRYSMLETIREYAWWRLVGRGEDTNIRRRYADYYLDLAEQAKSAMKGPEQLAWLDRLEVEHNNLRAVLANAVDSGDAETALELAGDLWKFWLTHGHLTEGRKWLAQSLDLQGSPFPEREPSATVLPAEKGTSGEGGRGPDVPEGTLSMLANALNGAGNLACACGDFEAAHPLYEQSLAIRRRQGDKAGIASSLNNLALTANSRCDYPRVKALHEESLAIKRELGDKWGIASSLGNLGIAMTDQGQYASARILHEESLALRRDLGDRLGVALSLLNLGIVVLAEALDGEGPTELSPAEALFEESLVIRKELVDRPGMAECLVRMGEVEHCRGNYAKAVYLYQQSLQICRELGDKPGISSALLNLGHVDMRREHPGKAAARFRESLTIRRQLGSTRGTIESLAAIAGVAAALGDLLMAGRLFGAVHAALRSTGFRLYPIDRIEYDRNLRLASPTSRVSEAAWATALSEGAAMSLDEAAAAALQSNQD
jgi:predicted ATPase